MTASVRRLAAVLVVGAAAVGLTACGGSGGENADLAAGKTTFVSLCSSCHTLADSGAPPSYIGPNLDDAWRASRQAGIEDSQYVGTIERWIRIAQLPMPRNLVKGQDAKNVAGYIASVAGKSPESAVYPATSTPEAPNPPRQEQE
jgi:mono/diheme cytochrome c family protein